MPTMPSSNTLMVLTRKTLQGFENRIRRGSVRRHDGSRTDAIGWQPIEGVRVRQDLSRHVVFNGSADRVRDRFSAKVGEPIG
jgi:hypothetical protein